jgi:transposase
MNERGGPVTQNSPKVMVPANLLKEDEMAPTRTTHFKPTEDVLAVALELSNAAWKIALHDGKRENPAIQTVSADNPARRLAEAVDVIAKIRSKWTIDPAVRTVVLYEAGQDGFWIHRALSRLEGFEVHVCDPSSIPVARHARRAKTDRLDAIRLVECLLAWLRGERGRMRVIHVPSAEEEAHRHLVRDRGQMQKEVLQHHDRIRKLLRTVGCWQSVDGDIGKRLAQGQLRCHDGSALPEQLQHRLSRECERLALPQQQFAALEKNLIEQLPPPLQERVTQLRKLKAVGPVGAVRMVLELFWREFDNRRQVGACVTEHRTGLAVATIPTGQRDHEVVLATRARKRKEQARQTDRHRGGGATAGDRVLALSGARRSARGRIAKKGEGRGDERHVVQNRTR